MDTNGGVTYTEELRVDSEDLRVIFRQRYSLVTSFFPASVQRPSEELAARTELILADQEVLGRGSFAGSDADERRITVTKIM